MLTVKYKKTGDAVYISHIDVQNIINRSVRRAGYEPEVSKGFNPHTLLKMSPPLPLGIESVAEYFTLYLDGEKPERFVERFNQNSPEGIKAVWAVKTDVYPNLAREIEASDYIIRDSRLLGYRNEIEERLRSEFEISGKGRQAEEKKEVSALILGFGFTEEGLNVKLAAGNTALRADRFLVALGGYLGLDLRVMDILRTAQYVRLGGESVDADIYIQNIAVNR